MYIALGRYGQSTSRELLSVLRDLSCASASSGPGLPQTEEQMFTALASTGPWNVLVAVVQSC